MKKCTMMQFRLCYVIIVVLLASVGAWADDQMVVADFSLGVDAKGVPKGWQLKEKSGQADFSIVIDDGLHALLLRSANTSFSIQKEVKLDVKQDPILSWKWKVTELPKGGDFRRSKTDDQAAQLFLAFTKTKAIVYIWDTTAPQDLDGGRARTALYVHQGGRGSLRTSGDGEVDDRDSECVRRLQEALR
jgi:hypothetical protein